jgi:predicted ribosome quality control (RQC) complex YloA/Tae2 family protein
LNQGIWLVWDKVHVLIYDDEGDDYRKLFDLDALKTAAQELIEAAHQEITRMDEAIAEFEQHNQAIAQAEAESKGLQNPELFSRYESHIQRGLNEALNRLADLKQQRVGHWLVN